MAINDDTQRGYIVMVEWDGRTPPTTWYNRLHKEGLYVRGSKDQTPLARRAQLGTSSAGVVYQEGCIICQSEGLARSVASYAWEQGATNVSVGLVRLDQFNMSERDHAILDSLNAVWGRRGRKSSADQGDYVITCLEDAHSWQVESDDKPMICPQCGSPMITWRKLGMDDQPGLQVGSYEIGLAMAGSLLQLWLDTRHQVGKFERPTSLAGLKYDLRTVAQGVYEADVVKRFASSKLAAELQADPIVTTSDILDIMDALQCLTKLSTEIRLNKRILALEDYYKQGGQAELRLSVPADPDMVEAAAVLVYSNTAARYIAAKF